MLHFSLFDKSKIFASFGYILATALFLTTPSPRICRLFIFYKGALVCEYYGKELLKEFEITAREKGLM